MMINIGSKFCITETPARLEEVSLGNFLSGSSVTGNPSHSVIIFAFQPQSKTARFLEPQNITNCLVKHGISISHLTDTGRQLAKPAESASELFTNKM